MAEFIGRKARPEVYSTATENYELEDDPQPGRTGRQTQWTRPPRFSQKLVDEEQGHVETSDHAQVTPNKLARPRISSYGKYVTSLEPKKLEIAQTRTYPDREPYPESEKKR